MVVDKPEKSTVSTKARWLYRILLVVLVCGAIVACVTAMHQRASPSFQPCDATVYASAQNFFRRRRRQPPSRTQSPRQQQQQQQQQQSGQTNELQTQTSQQSTVAPTTTASINIVQSKSVRRPIIHEVQPLLQQPENTITSTCIEQLKRQAHTIVEAKQQQHTQSQTSKAQQHADQYEMEVNANIVFATVSHMARRDLVHANQLDATAVSSSQPPLVLPTSDNLGFKAVKKQAQGVSFFQRLRGRSGAPNVSMKSIAQAAHSKRRRPAGSLPFHRQATVRVPCRVVEIREDPGSKRHILSRDAARLVFEKTAAAAAALPQQKGTASNPTTKTVQYVTPDLLRIFSRLPYTTNPATGNADVHVIMIDTGCNMSLAGKELNIDMATSCSVVPWETDVDDHNGHGTHTAGLAGAIFNQLGIVGSGSRVTLHIIKALDANGQGNEKTIGDALSLVWKWIAQPLWKNRHVIVNMSLGIESTDGTPVPWTTMDTTVTQLVQKGVAVVVAGGNSGISASLDSPAHAPSVLTVGAFAATTNLFAPFSNFGPLIDILAPGVDVLSLYLGTDLAIMSGTSMSTPLVAGLLAYIAHHHPLWSMAQCVTWLLQQARQLKPTLVNPVIRQVPAATINRSAYVVV